MEFQGTTSQQKAKTILEKSKLEDPNYSCQTYYKDGTQNSVVLAYRQTYRPIEWNTEPRNKALHI